MKKALITLLALGGTSMGATLVAGWDDFSSLQDKTQNYTLTLRTDGESTVNTEGVLHVQSNKRHNASVDLTSAGLTMDAGLTISITLSDIGHWGGSKPDIMWSFAISSPENDNNNEQHTFASYFNPDNDKTGILYRGGEGNVSFTSTSCSALETSTPVTLTMTILDKAVSLYKDGILLQSGTVNGDDTDDMTGKTIGLFSLGSWAGTSDNGRLQENVYDLAIYKGAMTAEEVKNLVSGTVPEPTTATLSLLALAGLAARRRRASR